MASLPEPNAELLAKSKEDDDAFANAFPELVADVVPEPEVEDEIITFYLWEGLKPIFDIYTIVTNYVVNEFHSLDSLVLIELIKDKGLNISDSLSSIPYIHSGYLKIVTPKGTSNGRPDQESNPET